MQHEAPTFLVDRSLGRYVVPDRVRSLVYDCLSLADFLGGEQTAQNAADVAWLDEAAAHDLVVLTRDGNLYINDLERAAVEAGSHRIFWIGPKRGPGPAWADRFAAHHQAITRRSRNAGPFVVKVQVSGLQTAWSR